MATAATVAVRARPGASKTGIVGFRNGALVVRIAAPPERGRANQALLDFLASVLGLKRRDLRLVAGERGRDKIIEVTGLTPEEVSRRLAAPREDAASPEPPGGNP